MWSAGGGLVSTIDDYWAFARMMTGRRRTADPQILSSISIDLMTTDQLTSDQKAFGGLIPNYFDSHGWGLGVSVTTAKTEIWDAVGRFGWDGGLGTAWYSSRYGETEILLTQKNWTSPKPPPVFRDFWTCACLARNRAVRHSSSVSSFKSSLPPVQRVLGDRK